MPPYVGKGINVENLVDCMVFLAGACSCQVKDQNPGMDLLMSWDWEKSAEIMAASDPQFAAGSFGYQEFEVGPQPESGSAGQPESAVDQGPQPVVPSGGTAQGDDGPAVSPPSSEPPAQRQ